VQTLLTVLTQKSRTRQALKMLASAQLDHPLDPTKRSSEIPVLWSRLPDLRGS
jgi:hypothetical protein